jgi:hypothetical protein
MNARQWQKSYTEGTYVSASGNYTAELRPAGYYAEFGCKMTRHYAIRLRGHAAIVGTARTLKEAGEFYK